MSHLMIALFANIKKKVSLETALPIIKFLHEHGIKVVARDEYAHNLNVPPLSSVDNSQVDFAISLGGDGTILRLIHNNPNLNVPILGINLGHLGFMADVPLSEAFLGLKDLLEGNYRIENRLMLEGMAKESSPCFAVNEIVIHRGKNLSLIDVSIYVDGSYFNTFSADGVIISTPCGSTAYSLASGGPILTPELEALVITPICAHTISNRPLVLMPRDHIELRYLSPYDPVDIIADGYLQRTLCPEESYWIKRCSRTFKMVNLKRADYFSTLRTKLGWSGQVRSGQVRSG